MLGRCSGQPGRWSPPPSTQPPAPAFLALLGSLRRPAGPADALPSSPASPTRLLPNPEATRLVRKDADGTRYYLGPVDNLHYEPPVPNKPGCRMYRIQRQRQLRRSAQGVCMFVFGRERSGTCGTADQIARGLSVGWGGGSGPNGVAHVSLTGIAPDGVRSVTVRWARIGSRTLQVIGNVYVLRLSGAAAASRLPQFAQPRILFHYSDGRVRQVLPIPVPSSVQRRARRQQRLVAARDRHATRVPSVYPPSGTPRKVFTLRVRLPLPRRPQETYVITLRGREPGSCRRQLVYITSASPSSGPQRRPAPIKQRYGLLNYGLGAYNVGPGREWCRDTYRGTVSFAPNGPKSPPRRLVGRFSFRVR